jgi:hypothetical protein
MSDARDKSAASSEGAAGSRTSYQAPQPQSALLLRRQLAELNKKPVEGFSAGLTDDNDIYLWEVILVGPPDTPYEGGMFKAHLTFPEVSTLTLLLFFLWIWRLSVLCLPNFEQC